jgi:DNA mismatch repair protein MSH5
MKRVLYVLEDTQETTRFDLIRMCKLFTESRFFLLNDFAVLEQVNPDLVLTSSKADDAFIDAVNEHSKRHPK